MKVSQEKQFTPITITLETQEELECLMAALYVPSNTIKEINSNSNRSGIVNRLKMETFVDMYNKINCVYHSK